MKTSRSTLWLPSTQVFQTAAKVKTLTLQKHSTITAKKEVWSGYYPFHILASTAVHQHCKKKKILGLSHVDCNDSSPIFFPLKSNRLVRATSFLFSTAHPLCSCCPFPMLINSFDEKHIWMNECLSGTQLQNLHSILALGGSCLASPGADCGSGLTGTIPADAAPLLYFSACHSPVQTGHGNLGCGPPHSASETLILTVQSWKWWNDSAPLWGPSHVNIP